VAIAASFFGLHQDARRIDLNVAKFGSVMQFDPVFRY
jgi:hypothetical protein